MIWFCHLQSNQDKQFSKITKKMNTLLRLETILKNNDISNLNVHTRGRMLSVVHSFISIMPKIIGYKSTLCFFFHFTIFFSQSFCILHKYLSINMSFEIMQHTKINNLLPLTVNTAPISNLEEAVL